MSTFFLTIKLNINAFESSVLYLYVSISISVWTKAKFNHYHQRYECVKTHCFTSYVKIDRMHFPDTAFATEISFPLTANTDILPLKETLAPKKSIVRSWAVNEISAFVQEHILILLSHSLPFQHRLQSHQCHHRRRCHFDGIMHIMIPIKHSPTPKLWARVNLMILWNWFYHHTSNVILYAYRLYDVPGCIDA